jgi:FKBP-type peptidyl-prolyl cis-trans isomerase FkpA
MSKKIFNLIFAAASVPLIIFVTSCDSSKKHREDEQNVIVNYLGVNPTLNYELKTSGLYYLDVLEGTGSPAVKNDTAYVKYKLTLLNGTELKVDKDTLVFPVDNGWWLPGFDESITYMNEGGKAQVIVPSSLAYAGIGYYEIPPYAPLLYNIELFKLVKVGSR